MSYRVNIERYLGSYASLIRSLDINGNVKTNRVTSNKLNYASKMDSPYKIEIIQKMAHGMDYNY